MFVCHNYFSNKAIANQDIFSEDQKKFMNILLKEKKKSENPSQKNRPKLLLETNQERVLNWLFKLSLEDRIKVNTISNKWLSSISLELSSLYTKDNEIAFEPTEEMLMNFKGEVTNTNIKEDYDDKNIKNDKKLYEKYFICRKKTKLKDSKTKVSDDMEQKFIEKYCNIISSDRYTITISEILLSDSKEFKRCFKYFSNNKFFTDILSPKNEYQNFTFPTWMFKTMNNLTLSQIIIGFFEHNVLLNYEYFYYTNRIYQSVTQNNITEIYEEIEKIDKQINNESFYLDNILSPVKYEEAIKIIRINRESKVRIFDEIKKYIIEINSEEGKIIKLLKKLTFLSFKEVNDRIEIYDSYKRFILDYIRSIIAKELINEDSKNIKSTKTNKKSKKKKRKKIKEIEENGKNKKEEIGPNCSNKGDIEQQIENIDSQNNTNNGEKKNEIKEKENIEQKSKKIKIFRLYPVNQSNKEKKKHKKKNKNKKSNKKSVINNASKSISFNDELIRICSLTSISTHKSSNYQKDLSIYEEDSSSINDINQNGFINKLNNDDNPKSSNTINIIHNNENNNDNIIINFNKRINNNNRNKRNCKLNINSKNKNTSNNSIKIINKSNNIKNYNNHNYTYQNNMLNIYNYNYHLFYYYKIGIDNYCSIINTNLVILNQLKKKNLKVIYDIINTNLNNKYLLKFGEYGSYSTGLSIEGSDIDICIVYKKLLNDNLIFREELYDILKKSEVQKEFTYKTKQIFDASIPRIILEIKVDEEIKKNINNYGNLLENDDINIIKIDFTLSTNEEYLTNNMKSVEYIKNQLISFPQIKSVIQILKRFLRRQKMNEVHTGGISSLTLFLLVLNCVKNMNPFMLLYNSHLLIEVFKKFTVFEFKKKGINEYNLDYFLLFNNEKSVPYIMNPLTGINVCKVGCCKGNDINNTFYEGYNRLVKEMNSFENIFICRINPFLINKSIDSIVNLLK